MGTPVDPASVLKNIFFVVSLAPLLKVCCWGLCGSVMDRLRPVGPYFHLHALLFTIALKHILESGSVRPPTASFISKVISAI